MTCPRYISKVHIVCLVLSLCYELYSSLIRMSFFLANDIAKHFLDEFCSYNSTLKIHLNFVIFKPFQKRMFRSNFGKLRRVIYLLIIITMQMICCTYINVTWSCIIFSTFDSFICLIPSYTVFISIIENAKIIQLSSCFHSWSSRKISFPIMKPIEICLKYDTFPRCIHILFYFCVVDFFSLNI